MILLLGLLLAFTCAAANDRAACAWQRARERGDVRRGIPLAMLMEGIAWVPVIISIELGTPVLALAGLAGAAVGTWWGFRPREFPKAVARYRRMESPFRLENAIAENALAFAVRDGYPISTGHTLVVSKRVVALWDDLTFEEQIAMIGLVRRVIDDFRAMDGAEDCAPDGFNVGINVGTAAGQTVPHVHIHVIPRFAGDCPDPRGGVRHCIPGKSGNYLEVR